jgi:hypothetical protein
MQDKVIKNYAVLTKNQLKFHTYVVLLQYLQCFVDIVQVMYSHTTSLSFLNVRNGNQKLETFVHIKHLQYTHTSSLHQFLHAVLRISALKYSLWPCNKLFNPFTNKAKYKCLLGKPSLHLFLSCPVVQLHTRGRSRTLCVVWICHHLRKYGG